MVLYVQRYNEISAQVKKPQQTKNIATVNNNNMSAEMENSS